MNKNVRGAFMSKKVHYPSEVKSGTFTTRIVTEESIMWRLIEKRIDESLSMSTYFSSNETDLFNDYILKTIFSNVDLLENTSGVTVKSLNTVLDRAAMEIDYEGLVTDLSLELAETITFKHISRFDGLRNESKRIISNYLDSSILYVFNDNSTKYELRVGVVRSLIDNVTKQIELGLFNDRGIKILTQTPTTWEVENDDKNRFLKYWSKAHEWRRLND